MTRSIQAEEKLEGFISKLESLGYRVTKVDKKPQIYCINDELVNIRSRGKSQETTYGRRFWYSVAFSVLQYVKWVIYITTDSDYFIMFPSSFLESLKDRMYPDRKKRWGRSVRHRLGQRDDSLKRRRNKTHRRILP